MGDKLGEMEAAPPSDATSLSLLVRAQANDPDAWRRLVQLFSPLVYYWGRKAGLNEHDAADLMQDVFRSVAGSLHRFRRDRPEDSFRGWLWGVTRNRIRDQFRARADQVAAIGGSEAQARLLDLPDQEPVCDDPSSVAGPGGLVRATLDLIRADYEDRSWQAFWRVAVDGQSPADVARDLGLSIFAVYQIKYRLTQRLRRELADLMS
jgi:RNA polymerase sigma-70 factor (ECF subfamily)